MDFSQKIKVLRKHNHLTQEEFADKVNVSRKTVSGWENRRSYPDNSTLESICKTFDIPKINLTSPDINDVFVNHLINNSKKHLSLIYLEVLELSLLFLSYISLLKIIDSFLIFLLLLINTIIIRSVLKIHISKKFIPTFQNDRKKAHIISGFLNLVIGMTSTIYNLTFHQDYTSALSTISGAIIGTIIHILLLSIAVTNLYQCYKIEKYTSLS
ncbi:helix-turn-helix transcriptional regulator [Holzapfeliella sp. JNUCC 80]